MACEFEVQLNHLATVSRKVPEKKRKKKQYVSMKVSGNHEPCWEKLERAGRKGVVKPLWKGRALRIHSQVTVKSRGRRSTLSTTPRQERGQVEGANRRWRDGEWVLMKE